MQPWLIFGLFEPIHWKLGAKNRRTDISTSCGVGLKNCLLIHSAGDRGMIYFPAVS